MEAEDHAGLVLGLLWCCLEIFWEEIEFSFFWKETVGGFRGVAVGVVVWGAGEEWRRNAGIVFKVVPPNVALPSELPTYYLPFLPQLFPPQFVLSGYFGRDERKGYPERDGPGNPDE